MGSHDFLGRALRTEPLCSASWAHPGFLDGQAISLSLKGLAFMFPPARADMFAICDPYMYH